MLAIPVLGRQKQGNLEFKTILGSIRSRDILKYHPNPKQKGGEDEGRTE